MSRKSLSLLTWRRRTWIGAWVVALLAVSALAAACGGPQNFGPAPPPLGGVLPPPVPPESVKPELRVDRTPPAPADLKPLVASGMAEDLRAIGLDPKNLPPLGKLNPDKLRQVMPTFTKALGARCTDCHLDDFNASTPKMRIAEKMWDEYSRGLAMTDGSLLYCDSCHQGRMLQLDRRDKNTLNKWMDEQYVGKLKRKDDSEHGCATCHGEGFTPKFLDGWAKPGG